MSKWWPMKPKWCLVHLVCVVWLCGCRVAARDAALVVRPGREWRCDFLSGSCGIVNQAFMPANFTLLPDLELFGEKGLLYLDTSNCRHSGGRLVTPYFSWRTRRVCLRIRFALFGGAISHLHVLKQDKRNVLLWSKLPTTSGWHEANIDVKVIPGYPARFFLEVAFNFRPNRVGFVAISNIALTDSFCPR